LSCAARGRHRLASSKAGASLKERFIQGETLVE
jgi:hypothetical protein